MSVLDAAPMSPGRTELRLAGHALGALALLALPLLGAAGALQGMPGVAGAAAGLGLVAVLFGAAGLAQGLAARRSRDVALAVAIGGFGVRLAVYLAALQALGQVDWLHRPSLAMATAVAFVVTLHHEIRVLSRSPEMFWLELDRDRSTARPPARRPLRAGEGADRWSN